MGFRERRVGEMLFVRESSSSSYLFAGTTAVVDGYREGFSEYVRGCERDEPRDVRYCLRAAKTQKWRVCLRF